MLLLILKSHTDEGFGRNVYKNVFFLSSYIYIYIYIHIYTHIYIYLYINFQQLASNQDFSFFGANGNIF